MPDETRKVDAVLLPAGFRGQAERINRLTEPILGPGLKHVRQVGGNSNLVTTEGDPRKAAMYHAKDHPTRPGGDRYAWEDAGGGVRYGYLIGDDAAAGTETVDVLPAPKGPPKPAPPKPGA